MRDVLIIGAGWTGLVCLKHLRAHGLDAIALEAQADIGGVWRFRETPGGVMRSTITTSSLTMTEISDFPMADPSCDFPHHSEVIAYLRRYAEHFDLWRHIQCSTPIARVQKIDGIWTLTDAAGEIHRARRLIVACGSQEFPNFEAPRARFEGFDGPIIHSSAYKAPGPEYYDQRVLVVGGGESAADIATELSLVTATTHMAVPNGQWFGERYREGISDPFPLEHFSTRLRRWVLPGNERPEMFALLNDWIARREGAHGHGIDAWASAYDDYGSAIVNKNTDVLRRIRFGRVVPKPAFERAEGNTVYFVDGSHAEFDAVILATGFINRFPFLAEVGRETIDLGKQYKMCLDLEDDSLAFCGFVRPTRGSFTSLSESQARYLAHLWSGAIPTPGPASRRARAEADEAARDALFKGANQRVRTLVNFFAYNDDLAAECGVLPDWRALFETNRALWWIAVTAPFHQCLYLINDPSQHAYVAARLEHYRGRTPRKFQVLGVLGRAYYEGRRARQTVRRLLGRA